MIAIRTSQLAYTWIRLMFSACAPTTQRWIGHLPTLIASSVTPSIASPVTCRGRAPESITPPIFLPTPEGALLRGFVGQARTRFRRKLLLRPHTRGAPGGQTHQQHRQASLHNKPKPKLLQQASSLKRVSPTPAAHSCSVQCQFIQSPIIPLPNSHRITPLTRSVA